MLTKSHNSQHFTIFGSRKVSKVFYICTSLFASNKNFVCYQSFGKPAHKSRDTHSLKTAQELQMIEQKRFIQPRNDRSDQTKRQQFIHSTHSQCPCWDAEIFMPMLMILFKVPNVICEILGSLCRTSVQCLSVRASVCLSNQPLKKSNKN